MHGGGGGGGGGTVNLELGKSARMSICNGEFYRGKGRSGNGTCVVTSNTGAVQVRWFILTHHGVGHTHKNSMVGHFSGSVRVIVLKSTHQWRTSTASFSSCQQPCLHGASSSNNGGTVALFCHDINQTIPNMFFIYEIAICTQHFKRNLNRSVRPGHVDLSVGDSHCVHGQYWQTNQLPFCNPGHVNG